MPIIPKHDFAHCLEVFWTQFPLQGLFIQEDASKALPSPGQHTNFGAKITWPSILRLLTPQHKLLFFIRHGEAVSNAVQASVGELAWASVATGCTWHNDSSGEALRLYDPSLTARGEEQVNRPYPPPLSLPQPTHTPPPGDCS